MSDRPPFATLRLDDLEAVPIGELVWRPLRRRLGIEAFGVNAWTGRETGDVVIEEHDESGTGAGRHEELYVVVQGRATFTVAGDIVDGPVGTLVFVSDPLVRRGAVAAEPGTTVLALGGRPGVPYTVSPWESWYAAEAFREAEDWDAALAVLREGLERFPDHGTILYATACFETLAGRHEDALAHLRRAAEVDARVPGWASDDVDLDALRDDPRFPR